MTGRPSLLIAMNPAATEHVLSDALLDRLAQSTDILDRQPVESFADARFRAVAERVDILLTGWGCPPIDAAARACMPRLRLVAHAAGSVKGLAPPDLFAAGIAVTSAADANARPVAEFTFAMIILALKQSVAFERRYARDRNRSATSAMTALPIGTVGRTVGIVGASRIGRRVIELLRQLDATRIIVSDPLLSATEASALGVDLVSLDALCATADVVTLHAPALPSTRHMIDARRLAAMRDGATLINTARGALVDEEALVAELEAGRLHAVIDVTDPEIPPPTSRLWHAPNLVLTPHIAGAIGLERRRLGEMAVAEIERFVAGEPLRHAVAWQQLETMA